MEQDFFADTNWPYKLELSGAIVTSATSSVTDQRFIDYHYFHHLPTALAALLALPSENFDQAIFPAGYNRPLFQHAAIIAIDTRPEVMSLYSIPLSAGILRQGPAPSGLAAFYGQAGSRTSARTAANRRPPQFQRGQCLWPGDEVTYRQTISAAPETAALSLSTNIFPYQ